MIAGRIEGETVAGWQPHVHLADAVTERDRAHAFAERIAAPFDTPPIAHDEPQSLLVTGGRWVVVTERNGLVARTTFLIPRFTWLDAFRQMAQPAPVRRWAGPMLVAGSRYRDNHFHWLFQNIGTVMMARHLGLDPSTPVLLPPMTDRLREPLALFGITNPVEILPDDAIGILTEGVLSTACSGDHGMNPHPAMLDLLRAEGARVTGARRTGRKIYLSRRDALNRRLPLNEEEVTSTLEARGFEIIAPGELSWADQIRAFREAAIIVAPHGAALSNLAWTEDGAHGPTVIELLQENFTNRAFARMAQVKRLNYHAIICECAQRADLLIDTRGRIDLPLLLRLLDQL
ncbi:glycosyltransferase family 61 protein [Sphingomonas sp.]|uniref:glycosyltransferase family 61 protein n=1 Tax=Sphingomonas sp. TaxID=28214 RepID=UPI003B3BB767